MNEHATIINHADLSKPRITKNEEDMLAVMGLLQTKLIKLFDTDIDDQVSLSTGVAPSQAIVIDLLDAMKKGEDAFRDFIETWLEDSKQTVHDKMSKSKS